MEPDPGPLKLEYPSSPGLQNSPDSLMITEFVIKICHPNKNPMIQPMCLISALLAHVESAVFNYAAMSKSYYELIFIQPNYSHVNSIADRDIVLKNRPLDPH